MRLQEYLAEADDALTVVLQVEHVEGVKNVHEILKVPGIDCIVIGPLDLSACMGLVGQFGHPDVRRAIRTVTEACREHGVPVGIFADAAAAKAHIEAGCTLIVLGADAVYLWRAVRQAMSELRGG
jgi:2-dehydro-3-deoxyglucarate aldolase